MILNIKKRCKIIDDVCSILARTSHADATNKKNGQSIPGLINKDEIDAFAIGMLTAQQIIVDGVPSDDPVEIVSAALTLIATHKIEQMEKNGSMPPAPPQESEGGDA